MAVNLSIAEFDVILKNSKNDNEFGFRSTSNLKITKLQPPVVINLPDSTPGSALLFRFQGQTEEIRFGFALYDDGTDWSDNDSIDSAVLMANYLRENIFTDEFDVGWTILVKDHLTSGTDNVVITQLNINRPAGSPKLITGDMVVIRGRTAALS